MILIFAHHYDGEASWLAQSLQKENAGIPIKIVIAEALGIDYNICLSIKSNVSKAMIFFNEESQSVASEDVTLVINRLIYVSPIIWSKSQDKEKLYATNEINSFFAAFIFAYSCKIINPIEHGCITGNRAGALQILKAVKKGGFATHPYLFEESNNSFRLMEANIGKCLRVMWWQNKIFFPIDQGNETFKNKVSKTLGKLNLSTTYELFFIEQEEGFQLINISKSPSLSIYGLPFLEYLSSTINILQPCY